MERLPHTSRLLVANSEKWFTSHSFRLCIPSLAYSTRHAGMQETHGGMSSKINVRVSSPNQFIGIQVAWSEMARWWLSSVQLLSRVRLFSIPWTAAGQASLSITNSQSLLKLMSIELVMPSTISSHLLSSPSPPAFSLTQHQGLYQWVSSSHQVAKVLKFQL